MKLVSFSLTDSSLGDAKIRPGSLIEDENLVLDLSATGYTDTLAVIAAGITVPNTGTTFPSYPLADVRLHAPLANPPRIFAIGLNYRDSRLLQTRHRHCRHRRPHRAPRQLHPA